MATQKSRFSVIDSLCEQVLLVSALGGVFLGMGGFIAQSLFWLGCGLMTVGFGVMTLATLLQNRLRREALALEKEALRWRSTCRRLDRCCEQFLRAQNRNNRALAAQLKGDE